MLAHHRRPVCLSMVSTDLPVWSTIETAATLYQKDKDKFHILLTEPPIPDWESPSQESEIPKPRLIWLEISPYRVIMTMQTSGKLSYRHLWETGVYGISRYWLNNDSSSINGSLRLRNYTRNLILEGRPLPKHLQVEYELWSQNLQLGRYILNLDIHH
jgi:hypothetical protein